MKRRKWLATEKQSLRRLSEGGVTDDDIAIQLNRTRISISRMRDSLGIKKPDRWPKWTAECDTALKSLWTSGQPIKHIAELMGLSETFIRDRAYNHLGLPRYVRRQTKNRCAICGVSVRYERIAKSCTRAECPITTDPVVVPRELPGCRSSMDF